MTQKNFWKVRAISLLQISSNKYNDPRKVSVLVTPMGNYRLYYGGKDTGLTVGRNQLYID